MEFFQTTFGRLILIALCVLSAVSFVPQLLRIAVRRDSSGVALFYVLFNLINATQQLTIGGIYIGFAEERPFFAWSWPQSATDWINVVQLLVFWAGTLTLFIACLVVTPYSRGSKALAILVYLFVLIITLIPLVVVLNDPNDRQDGKNSPWFAHLALFFAHVRFLVPVVTFFAAASFYPEARAIFSRPPGDVGSLSVSGLLIQAVVFAAVALSWAYRVKWPESAGTLPLVIRFGWYRLVGWAVVDNAIFAAVQALLWLLAHRRSLAPIAPNNETESLLG